MSGSQAPHVGIPDPALTLTKHSTRSGIPLRDGVMHWRFERVLQGWNPAEVLGLSVTLQGCTDTADGLKTIRMAG